ncbi:MAG: histidine phosphatase family protein [Saprospiraceae bacterium]|nr:histidine phosphatase family protein [Pyrinomonadaceae bacterium]
MKVSRIILCCITFLCLAGSLAAQSKKTILLVRHAEKADATSADPELSAAGRERALRLVETIGKYKPGAFYSTDFKRTRDTLAPFAGKRKKQVQIYDAKNPQKLFDEMMRSKTKRFVVAGHSNTIPGLANLMTKKELFRNLDDSEYGAIWVVRIKNGQIQKVEILPY